MEVLQMWSKYGRTVLTQPFIPSGVSTGSAYNALDACGAVFEIPEACGQLGAFLSQVNFQDLGTANPTLRLHLFNALPSGTPNGEQWTLTSGDFGNYLGFVQANGANWVSASGSNIVCVKDQAMFLHSQSAQRSIFGQVQLVSAATFGNITNPLRGNLGVSQD